MSWSLTLFKVAGSEIRIHLTFLLFLAWIGIADYFVGGPQAAINGIVFLVAVFACVALHELGHAIAARRYGIETPDITLLPIGGLARLSRIPDKPGEEIVIALAGPAVNLVIAAVLFVLGGGFDVTTLTTIDNPAPGFIDRLLAVNVFLAVFNLIPAFPMDGGRVLRAALAIPLGRQRATQIAAGVGQALAFLFGFLGLLSGNAILVFIAIFVYLAAAAEAGQVGLMEIARRLRVEEAMVDKFESLGVGAVLESAAEALLRTTQREFPILDGGGRLRGFLTREALIDGLRQTGPQTPVLQVMTEVPTVRAGERLSAAVNLMQAGSSPIVAVTGPHGAFLGYVSQENLGEIVMVESAREERAPPPRAAA